MERLTEKHYLGTDHYMKCSGSCNVDMYCIDCPSFDRLVERLAAYEETGLTPKEVKRMSNILLDVGIDYNCSWEYVKNWLLDARLRELAEADRAGRLVVLPCKAGDTVYRIVRDADPHIARDEVRNMYFADDMTLCVELVGGRIILSEKFGKTVFLTREEAEKALEAMKDGN